MASPRARCGHTSRDYHAATSSGHPPPADAVSRGPHHAELPSEKERVVIRHGFVEYGHILSAERRAVTNAYVSRALAGGSASTADAAYRDRLRHALTLGARLEKPEQAGDAGHRGGDIAEAAVPHSGSGGGDGLFDGLRDHRDLEESGGRRRNAASPPPRAPAGRGHPSSRAGRRPRCGGA